MAKDPLGDGVSKGTVEVDEFGEGDIVTVPHPLTSLVRMSGTRAAPDGASPLNLAYAIG